MALTLIGTPLTLTTSDTALAEYDITSGIDGTYQSYEFHCVNMYPEINNVNFCFQVNAATGSNTAGFDQVITSNSARAYLKEDGTGGTLAYDANSDHHQEVSLQRILSTGTGDDADQSVSGILRLYAPSSTTYVKHFLAEGNGADHGDYTVNSWTAGYINTTEAIDEITFKFDSGDIEAGTIKMFGVS